MGSLETGLVTGFDVVGAGNRMKSRELALVFNFAINKNSFMIGLPFVFFLESKYLSVLLNFLQVFLF